MTNVPLMFQPLVKYADFNGRSRRSEFWLWVLFRILLGSTIGAIASSLLFSGIDFAHIATSSPEAMHERMWGGMTNYMRVMPLLSLINLALLVPSYAVGVRRLHDTGRSGWWIVLPLVVAIVGTILFLVFGGTALFHLLQAGDHPSEAQGLQFAGQLIGSLFLFLLLPILVAEIVMLVFYVTEGKRGPNRFGPDPKGEALNDTP